MGWSVPPPPTPPTARRSGETEQGASQIRYGWHPREWGWGGGSGCRETAVDESREETADKVARYQTDYVGKTCLCYPYHTLLRLPRNCFCCALPVLSLLVVLCLFMLLYRFVLVVTSPGGAQHSLFIFYYFISFFVVSSVFLSVNASGWLAFICRTCRIQYVGRSLHCLLCLLHYALQCSIYVSWFCDHRACISLEG